MKQQTIDRSPCAREEGGSASTASVSSIVVDMDESYEAGEALGWAARLSRGLGRDLVAARRWEPGLGEFGPGAHEKAKRQLEKELHEWCVLARDAEVEPSCEVVEGPAEALMDFAERCPAMMVAVGLGLQSTRSPASAEAFARRVLHNASHALALVPIAGASRPIRRIVVGIENTANSAALKYWAAMIAEAFDAEVIVVKVIPFQAEWVAASDPRSMWGRERSALVNAWTPATTAVNPLHRAVDIQVVEGSDPVESWIKVAHRNHADMFIVCLDAWNYWFNSLRVAPIVRLAREGGLAVLTIPRLGSADAAR